MRTSPHALALWLLAFATAVTANPFWFRDKTSSPSASATVAPSSKAAPSSASTTAPPAKATAINSTPAGNGTSNGTAAETSSSSATATSSAFLSSTPENLRCHRDREGKPDKDIEPFCEPREGQDVILGETLNVTWDPTLFVHNVTVIVELHTANGTNTSQIGGSGGLPNEKGYCPLLMNEDYVTQFGLRNNSNLTLFIHSTSEDGNPIHKPGPVFMLITNSTSNHTSHGGNSSKELGEKAGIPIGLGILLIAAAGFIFWLLRRRRNTVAGYMVKPMRSTRMTGDESSGGASGFRDEPTRGLELQDRVGHGRQDSWEAGWDTSSSQGGGGNVFRDEIDRQRRR